MAQSQVTHPLAAAGYCPPPHWLWRFSRRLFVIAAALNDMRLIALGRLTLHRAWQAGLDHGRMSEYQRIIVNGGDLVPFIQALREARGALWELHNWRNAAEFEEDPAVKSIDAVLARYPRPSPFEGLVGRQV